MKRILAILLSVSMLGIFCACGGSDTQTEPDETKKKAESSALADDTSSEQTGESTDAPTATETERELTADEVLNDALTKRDAYKSFTYTSETSLEMLGTTETVNGVEKFVSADNTEYSNVFSAKVDGEESESKNTYYTDGKLYIDEEGELFCGPVSTEDLKAYLAKEATSAKIPMLAQTCKKFSIEKAEGGFTVTAEELDPAAVVALVDSDASMEGIDVEVSGNIVFNINENGDIVSEKLDVTFKLSQSGISMELGISISGTFSDVNTLDDVTFDGVDLDEYKHVDDLFAAMELADAALQCVFYDSEYKIDYKLQLSDGTETLTDVQNIVCNIGADENYNTTFMMTVQRDFPMIPAKKTVIKLSQDESYTEVDGVKTAIEYSDELMSDIMYAYDEPVIASLGYASNIKIEKTADGTLYTFDISEDNAFIIADMLLARTISSDMSSADMDDIDVKSLSGEILVDNDGYPVYYMNKAEMVLTKENAPISFVYESKISANA